MTPAVRGSQGWRRGRDVLSAGKIAHPHRDAVAASLAASLAAALGTETMATPGAPPRAAMLCVASASYRWHRAATIPVVVLTRRARGRQALAGRTVVCGVYDECDAAAVAIADVLADTLAVPIVLAHAVPHVNDIASPPDAAPVYMHLSEIDQAAAKARVRSISAAAGVDCAGKNMISVLIGHAASALARKARADDAAFVVVGSSRSRRVARAFTGSSVERLLRNCDRPVVVCPDHVEAAMRLRDLRNPWR
jgi:nucleotide-binding universal stress UspA family protein